MNVGIITFPFSYLSTYLERVSSDVICSKRNTCGKPKILRLGLNPRFTALRSPCVGPTDFARADKVR
jgi:hypothetical protein